MQTHLYNLITVELYDKISRHTRNCLIMLQTVSRRSTEVKRHSVQERDHTLFNELLLMCSGVLNVKTDHPAVIRSLRPHYHRTSASANSTHKHTSTETSFCSRKHNRVSEVSPCIAIFYTNYRHV